ncbi:MAG: insulinase family protein, partial [Candidatus Tectomicrobia bacterium]
MPTLKRQLCRVTIAFLGLICLSWTLALAAEDWAIPLPTDAAIHTGRLSNGVTYWIRSHATPPGKISLWMHVSTGSVNEKDGQQGVAHYLEHMAFNGTQHFPPGALIKYFESIGL